MEDKLKKLKIEYDSQSNLAGQFAHEVSRQLEALISKQDVKLGFPIQNRVKTWSSIEEKISRVGLKLKSLSTLEDLVGLRITLTFLRDVEKVQSIIEDTFDVKKTKNISDRLSSNQFGYNSIHLVVKCPKAWESVPSLSHLANFKAEVQIRTLAQHIWAEVSHQLQYKNEDNVPNEVLRSISRSSALLETVDLEFERVLANREEYRSDIKKAHTLDGMPINSDNLEILLEEIIPNENRVDGDDYAYLITECHSLGIQKISELREIIENHRNTIMLEEKKEVKKHLKTIHSDGSNYPDFLRKRLQSGVFYSYVGIARLALTKQFGEETMIEILLKDLNDKQL